MDHLVMRFYGTQHGRRFYRVLRDGRAIFTGTKGECNRYIRLHLEKQKKDMATFSVPRRRRVMVKRYRVAARRLAAG